MNRGGARILVRGGGNIGQNFIYEFNSSPVLRRQNVGSKVGTYSKNVIIKYFWKIYKKFAQKYKNSRKFFKNKI